MDGGQNLVFIMWGGALIIGLLSWFFWDKRYRRNKQVNLPPGCRRTDEVFIDPVDGSKQRVYYHDETGERYYLEEK
ncbi:MAG: hypothetical protein ACM3QZ_02005 [Solirubrobacterales bacterium]